MGGGGSKTKSGGVQEGYANTSGNSTSIGNVSSTDSAISRALSSQQGTAIDSGLSAQQQLDLRRQDEQYGRLLGGADELLGGQGFYDSNYAGGMDTYAGWTPEQSQLFSSLTGEGGAVQGALGSLNTALGTYDPNNPALAGVIDATAGDLQRNFDRNTLVGINQEATAAGVGQLSGSRAGIAEGLARSDMSQQLADVSSNLRYNDYQNFQGNQQNALANLGNIGSSLAGIAGMGQAEQQSELDNLFNKWEYESGVARNNLSAYQGLIGGDMGGLSSGLSQTQNVNVSDMTSSNFGSNIGTSNTASNQQTSSASATDYYANSNEKSKGGGK